MFINITANIMTEITSMIKSKVPEWMSTQALFIQSLFGELCWENWRNNIEESGEQKINENR